MIDATKLLEQKPMARMMMESSDFTIAAVDAVEPITLEQAKAHLRVVFDDEDDYISSLIVTARQMAEDNFNRTIVPRVREQAFCSWWDIKLLKPPLISVESVSYIDMNGDEQALSDADWVVNSRKEPARISLSISARSSPPSIASQEDAVIVRYTAGYPVGEVPYPLIQWMLLVIGAFYENREAITAGVIVTAIPEAFTKWITEKYMVYE